MNYRTDLCSLIILSCHVWKVAGSIPSHVKTKTLKLVFAASPLSTQHLGVRAKTGQSRVRKMCLGKVACLPMDCCFHELAH